MDTLGKDTKTFSRLPKNNSSDCITIPASNNGPLTTDLNSVSNNKGDGDSMKALSNHPVSILAGKLDPMRRNSYGYVRKVSKMCLKNLLYASFFRVIVLNFPLLKTIEQQVLSQIFLILKRINISFKIYNTIRCDCTCTVTGGFVNIFLR